MDSITHDTTTFDLPNTKLVAGCFTPKRGVEAEPDDFTKRKSAFPSLSFCNAIFETELETLNVEAPMHEGTERQIKKNQLPFLCLLNDACFDYLDTS